MPTIRNIINYVITGAKTPSRYVRLHTYENDYIKYNISTKIFADIDDQIRYSPIVSITSYGERLQTVYHTILSILDQNIPPKKIVLYLDESIRYEEIPEKLRRLQSSRFEIRLGYPDIKSHKKYFFAMQEFPDDIIVTVDDDMIYRRDTLEDLIEGYKNHPNCVIARRVHKIKFNTWGDIRPYEEWEYEYNKRPNVPSIDLFATGCGAVLYPPHIIPKSAFDIDAIEQHCLYADDIWLKAAQLSDGIPVVYVPNSDNRPAAILGTQTNALYRFNYESNRNNTQLFDSLRYFGVTLSNIERILAPSLQADPQLTDETK